jgi:hypothetical protein
MQTRASFSGLSYGHFLAIHICLAATLGLFLLVRTASAATLVHRYPFESNANDVIGSMNGVVMGGATFDEAGGLLLDGTNDCVKLPAGIISDLDEVSVEAWVTWQRGTKPYWQRIFDFGNYAGNSGRTYFFLTPATALDWASLPDWMRASISTNGPTAETPWLDLRMPMPTNVETHVAVTYSPALGMAKLYLNGVAVATGVATIPLGHITDTNNWLGKSAAQVFFCKML